MRSWTADADEFDDPDSEQSVQIHCAVRSGRRVPAFPDAASFVAAVVNDAAARGLGAAVPFNERMRFGAVRKHLDRFAGLSLPVPCDWPTHVLCDEWNQFHLVLCGPDRYISYFWQTTA